MVSWPSLSVICMFAAQRRQQVSRFVDLVPLGTEALRLGDEVRVAEVDVQLIEPASPLPALPLAIWGSAPQCCSRLLQEQALRLVRRRENYP
jgi:hypothetical protein